MYQINYEAAKATSHHPAAYSNIGTQKENKLTLTKTIDLTQQTFIGFLQT